MSFMDKVSKTFSKVSQKTSELASTTQLKYNLNKKNNEIKEKYKILGEHYYNSVKESTELDAFTKELVSDVTFLKTEAKEIEDEIEALLPKKTVCDACGEPMKGDMKYCSLCGGKAITIGTEVEITTTKVCPECDFENDHDATFCVNCGTGLE